MDRVDGGQKGQTVSSETQRILNRIMSQSIQKIQAECNRVANLRREKWKDKDQNAMMIEEGLPNISYKQGIRELDPPFSLTCPASVHMNILDSVSSHNPKVAAQVITNLSDRLNPKLEVFLPTLDVKGSTINWIGFTTTFQSVIIHEFLHLCGDIQTPFNEIRDGLIRHTWIGTEAITNLIGNVPN